MARRPGQDRQPAAGHAVRRPGGAVADRQHRAALRREHHHPRDGAPPPDGEAQPARPRPRQLPQGGAAGTGTGDPVRPPEVPDRLGRPVREPAALAAAPDAGGAGGAGADVRAAVRRLPHLAPPAADPLHRAARRGRRPGGAGGARHDAQRLQRGGLHRPVRRGDPERHHHGRQPQPLARAGPDAAAGGDEGRAAALPPGADRGDGGHRRPDPGGADPCRGQRRAAAAGHGDHRRHDHRHGADPDPAAGPVFPGRGLGAAAHEGASARGRPLARRTADGGQMSRRAWSLLGGLGLALGAAQADDAPPPADAAVLGDRVLNLAAPRDGWSVQASATAGQALTWPMFIREVLASNLDFAAQRYNVDMAQADAEAARLLPNPSLSLSGDRDLTFHDRYATGTDGQPALLRQPENRSIGLDQTLEWPGKRHWRIKMADQTLRAAAATLQDFLRNLKLDAASAFADALLAQRTVEQLRAAAGFLAELDQAQQARFKAGDIGQPDLAQSQVEEQQFLNQLSKAEDDAEATRYALSTFLGRDRGRTDFVVSGELAQAPRDLDLAATLAEALKN